MRGGRSNRTKPIAPTGPTAPFTRGSAGAKGRAMPDTTVREGRLTTIKPGTAAVAGLPSGAVGGAMAGTPPRRSTGARLTNAPADPADPQAPGSGRASPVAAAAKGRFTTTMPEAAEEAGLPIGAIGGAMAGTPPDRGAGALVTPHRPSGSAGPGTTRRGGTLVADRMAPADFSRAGAWQPACCAELAITMRLRITMP
eukprot:scaffold31808_cov94-Isochrysis_galbana.AAC.1